ncbi:ABSCISIC ACID-INSENSITIVE 5-like protein 1 [Benincasa hispida]|uniref:ABSCISIC ACID-INSENSITIVE 5-like protein 1 n=1 Tax=Benincasa hispida TaxID=102211 RepID=UPI0019022B76|nr:ABSCISIC ACID-INSENSITIVE 5-like protein 1 [Benincasa hispida]XP_038902608.1 ABSCISIC ACID-INSENSITIVE 5-like protein 1 [Benincasa hispida]
MENSQLEDMAIVQMTSEAEAATATQANKHESILSLTLDEIQCKSGKNFGGMSMDEFLANIWNVEDLQTQFHSQSQENEPQNHSFLVANNSRPNLCSQGSFSIPIPLCGKTVDEIWSEIHKDQQHPHHQKFINVQQNPCQSQQALGEMTLEDFLVKAGVVQEASSSASMKQQLCSANNRSMVDLGFGVGEKLGLSLSYRQNSDAARIRNMSGNCFSNYQMLIQSVGEPSDNSSIQKCQSLMTDWVEPSNKRRIIDGPAEVVVQRRQRRMIKNRESAARSRARKQAYTVELEVELNQLKEENIKLKQIVAESERNRKQEIMQRKQPEKRQKPTEKLRAMRRIASMAW